MEGCRGQGGARAHTGFMSTTVCRVSCRYSCRARPSAPEARRARLTNTAFKLFAQPFPPPNLESRGARGSQSRRTAAASASRRPPPLWPWPSPPAPPSSPSSPPQPPPSLPPPPPVPPGRAGFRWRPTLPDPTSAGAPYPGACSYVRGRHVYLCATVAYVRGRHAYLCANVASRGRLAWAPLRVLQGRRKLTAGRPA